MTYRAPFCDFAMHGVQSINIDAHLPRCANMVSLKIETKRGVAMIGLFDVPPDVVDRLKVAFGDPPQAETLIAAE